MKFFNKKILLGIITVFSFSCSENNESIEKSNKSKLHQLNANEIITVSNMLLAPIEKRNSSKLIQIQEEVSPIIAYSQILAAQNMNMQIDSRILPIMDNSYEENIQFLRDLNLISSSEINIINNLNSQINSTHDFEKSINNFSESILNLPLTVDKKQKYINFIDGLKILNQMQPEYFKDTLTPDETLFGSCLSASIGVGIAFVGLATIEVGSFGLATGAAVVGFIWASAEWGKACKDKGGQKVPVAIKKIPKKVEFDEDGNIITERDENFITADDDFDDDSFRNISFNVIVKYNVQ